MTREWLYANGLGSYASGTLSDTLTRRYHGLFVPALNPPVGRRVLLNKFDASAQYDGRTIDLSSNRWHDGTIAPRGDAHIVDFRIDGRVPVWTYAFADALLERRIWMERGEQIAYVEWRLRDASTPVELTLKAYVNDRDYHALTRAYDIANVAQIDGDLATVRMGGGTTWYLRAPGARIEAAGQWYYGFCYEAETERGLDDVEDLYYALAIHGDLTTPGARLVVRIALDPGEAAPGDPHAGESALRARWRSAHPRIADPPHWVDRLVLAADSFVVARTVDGKVGSTVIAGYHWFGDWGRDTMIALPGLTLTTGRPEIARDILETFARFVDRGMLPNCFPDSGSAPEYNTVDAALWFIETVRYYHAKTQDTALLAAIFERLDEIVECYTNGTRYDIGVDPADGLVHAGQAGVQLTWMDAKIGDWVVTPRIGKPIEINALWYNALCAMDGFAQALGRNPARYRDLGSRARASFERFWNPQTKYPFDVLDSPQGNDPSIRPNAVYAVALPFRAFDNRRERTIVDRAAHELWTPMGLRSLAPSEPEYTGHYGGSPRDRDAAYHRGTAWPFLAGAFARAYANAYGDRSRALRFIEALACGLDRYGIGTLAEIADGDAPHDARGCISQAWSVGEVLRTWHDLQESEGKCT